MSDEQKKTYSTSFKIALSYLAFVGLAGFLVKDYRLWATAICMIGSFYMISRGLYKRHRAILQYSGIQATEFKVLIGSTVLIFIPVLCRVLVLDWAVFFIGILVSAYLLSRGLCKDLLIKHNVQMIR